MTTLTFQNTTLSVIDQNNQKWLPALEVGRALGYSNPSVSISQLYDRNKDEFTSSMTAIIEMNTASGMQKVRIFSLRGCWLLGMRSHTKVAKDFRRWVLDILDQEVQSQKSHEIRPLVEPPKTYSVNLTEKELHILSVVMDKYVPMVTEFCDNVEAQQRNVYTALGLNPKQNNPLAARAYSINHEFRYWTDEAKEIIQRINAKKNYALANF